MKLVSPSTILISGPSQAGKSEFVRRVIEENLFEPRPEKIFYCYSVWSDAYSKLRGVTLVKGLPKECSIKNSLVVMDDLMAEMDGSVADLFTKNSHHCNCSVIFIVQNLFYQNKLMRTVSLNSHYIVVFKNPRDSSQIRHLAMQISPSNPKFVCEAYKDSVSRPYGYLLFDLRQETPDQFRLRTNILKSEFPEIIYQPKDGRCDVSEGSG